MKGHHRLEVWKRAIEMVTNIYKITEDFPKTEIYGLSMQMRKSAISIPSNIAEGAGRSSKKEFEQFLSIAQGSVSELETQLIIANKLNYISDIDNLIKELDETSKMILGLSKSLKNKNKESLK
jgi:four helix bundle protein